MDKSIDWPPGAPDSAFVALPIFRATENSWDSPIGLHEAYWPPTERDISAAAAEESAGVNR